MNTGLLNSNHLEFTKISRALLLFSILSALILFAAGFYYKDLGCDGGWYSYPALALSRGGNPAENLGKIENIKSVQGVKAIFEFDTYTSIRIFYTTLWFKYVSINIFSLKFLSLLELIALIILGYFIISQFCQDKVIVLMLLAVFINDKTIILNAASDYRPDNMVAALSCLTFLTMLKQNRQFSLISAILAGCLMMLAHITAVIPFLCIMCFFILQNIFHGKYYIRENYKYLAVGILALLLFFNVENIFDTLFLPYGESLHYQSNVSGEIFDTWNKGLSFILNKELYRWKTYFFTSNIAPLLVLLFGVILFFRRSHSFLKRDKIGLSLLLSTITGFILFALVDPHRADMHVIPIIPFFFLILSHAAQSLNSHRKALRYVLVGLVCFASLSSIALAGKIFIEGKRSGYNITKLTKFFEEIISDTNREYLIVGPTEIWPFIEEEKNVLIFDRTRSGTNLQLLEPILDSVDYVVINRDINHYKWNERFLDYFPNLFLKKIRHIGSQDEFIKIYKIEKKDYKIEGLKKT